MAQYKRMLCKCGALCRAKGLTKAGKQMYDKCCWKCRENGYRVHKKTYCELCGFVAVHTAQLDVDHVDGNHFNDELSNLMTLCANCHRLKTVLNNDHQPVRGEHIVAVMPYPQLELVLDA